MFAATQTLSVRAQKVNFSLPCFTSVRLNNSRANIDGVSNGNVFSDGKKDTRV